MTPALVRSPIQPSAQVLTRWLMVLALMLLCLASGLGCASLRTSEWNHAVLIRSEPPGARILVDGKDAGVTPGFVSVKRSKNPSIEIATTDGRQVVPLETYYRWSGSFFTNFTFLTYAPIGWAIDLFTGTAWEAKDPEPLKVRLSRQDLRIAKRRMAPPRPIAIAPPRASSIGLSDNAAEMIQERLRQKTNHFTVRPYDETLPTFIAHHYDFDGRPTEGKTRDLYYNIGTHEVFESEVEPSDEGLLITGRLKNVITSEISEPMELLLEPNGDLERIYAGRSWWSFLLPNTVGLDLSNESLRILQGEQEYEFTPVSDKSVLGQASRYLTSLHLLNLPQRRAGRAARWQFTFVPTLRLSRRQVRTSGLEAGGVEEQEYSRWWVSGGYGPEVGYQVGSHYLYLNVVPLLFWSEISWERSGQRRSVQTTGLETQGEAGYVYFFNSNWSATVFTRTQGEDTSAWSRALSDVMPNMRADARVSTYMGGLALAYRFEPAVRGR